MTSQHRFYVYVLARPNGKPFYVGKGQGNRVYSHETEAKSGHKCHKCNVIRKIWRQGGEVQRYIVFTTDDVQEALDYEREQIAMHGRKNLTNRTDGGEATSGWDPSPETRAKISKAQRHRFAENPELRAKNAAHIKSWWESSENRAAASDQGRRRFEEKPELRTQISDRQKQRYARPEERERLREQAKAQMSDPAQREKARERARARMQDPAQKERLIAANKAYFDTPEGRSKHSTQAKTRMSAPEFRARLKDTHNSPETLAKHSAASKAMWERRKADPDWRGKLKEARRKTREDPAYTNPLIGRKHTDTAKEKMRRAAVASWARRKAAGPIIIKGHKHTEESKEKMRQAAIRRCATKKGKEDANS